MYSDLYLDPENMYSGGYLVYNPNHDQLPVNSNINGGYGGFARSKLEQQQQQLLQLQQQRDLCVYMQGQGQGQGQGQRQGQGLNDYDYGPLLASLSAVTEVNLEAQQIVPSCFVPNGGGVGPVMQWPVEPAMVPMSVTSAVTEVNLEAQPIDLSYFVPNGGGVGPVTQCPVEPAMVPVPAAVTEVNLEAQQNDPSYFVPNGGGVGPVTQWPVEPAMVAMPVRAPARALQAAKAKSDRWSKDEHKLFLLGMWKYKKGSWNSIARDFVQTRTPSQVASHAQKYFNYLKRKSNEDDESSGSGSSSSSLPSNSKRRKRRESIHSYVLTAADQLPANVIELRKAFTREHGLPYYDIPFDTHIHLPDDVILV